MRCSLFVYCAFFTVFMLCYNGINIWNKKVQKLNYFFYQFGRIKQMKASASDKSIIIVAYVYS